MNGVWTAAISSAAFGASDFVGGLASRRHTPAAVLMVSTPVSAVLALPVWALSHEATSVSAMVVGALAGWLTLLAVMLLYAAMARGPIAQVSTVSSVVVALAPVALGLALGESIGPMGVAGVVLAAVSVPLVSFSPAPGPDAPFASRKATILSVLAGLSFALSFVAAHRVPPGMALTGLLSARVAAVLAMAIISLGGLLRAAPHRQHRSHPPFAWGIAVGMLDTIANTFMFLAFNQSALIVVSVIESFYPAVTVALAILLLREPCGPRRVIGFAGSLLAIGLLTVNG